MTIIKEFIKKYAVTVKYIFFGGLTTLVNMLAYSLCYDLFQVANTLSTVIAWVLSVAFAFVTNKLFVFGSRRTKPREIFAEAFDFTVCRIVTGLLELGIMYLSVDILGNNGTVMKLLTNVIVIVLNYIASKLIIFKKDDSVK